MNSKFEVFNLLSKFYASNTTNNERKEVEAKLAEFGKLKTSFMEPYSILYRPKRYNACE